MTWVGKAVATVLLVVLATTATIVLAPTDVAVEPLNLIVEWFNNNSGLGSDGSSTVALAHFHSINDIEANVVVDDSYCTCRTTTATTMGRGRYSTPWTIPLSLGRLTTQAYPWLR
jgi:hypothetical protein